VRQLSATRALRLLAGTIQPGVVTICITGYPVRACALR
jgi:hypothetical protein